MDTTEQGNESTAGAAEQARRERRKGDESSRDESGMDTAEQARRERREGDESRRNELGFGWWGAAAAGGLYTAAPPAPSAVPEPCRPLERAVPGPALRADSSAQARARHRARPGTGTAGAG